jgi:cobaltochelatase CobS
MKIKCKLCEKEVHSIQIHLNKEHANEEVGIEDYRVMYPDEPVFSEEALKKLESKKTYMTTAGSAVKKVVDINTAYREPLAKLFKVSGAKSKNSRGEDIIIKTFPCDEEHKSLIPEIDNDHVWDIDLLKDALMGLDLKMPTLIWGHAGTGKSTSFENIASRLGLPMMRVQHTANTEESHILGQWTVKDGETVFELGPLPLAMKYGYMYLADEYDFAFPSVLSVYQPVMEGKSLLIKEADAENRVIKPHKNFRFVATGNTNGTGDESGLYQGTNIQNAANYSRFGMTIEAGYMEKKYEIKILMKKAGVLKEDAEKLVNFASSLREAFSANKIGSTIGPRELIHAGMIGSRKGDLRNGLKCAFVNRLSEVDAEAVDQIAQRYLG